MALQSKQFDLSGQRAPRWDEPMKVGTQGLPEGIETTCTMLALANENARLTQEIMNVHASLGYDAAYKAAYGCAMSLAQQSLVGSYYDPSYAPFGLALSSPFPRVNTSHRKTLPGHSKKSQRGFEAKNTERLSDVSTVASSSPPSSLVTSRCNSRERSAVGEQDEKQEVHYSGKTTVMMRNLPNDYTRDMVVELLDNACYKGRFSFIYVPIDFQRKAGLGYAFINFVDSESAMKFQKEYTGFRGWSVTSDKMCEVVWSDMQGLQTHIDIYRNNPVMHESVPEEYKPRLYEGSEIKPFPPPTKSIRAPRHWNRRKHLQ
mmetsp:Transcript_3560/g.5742  ORF Transcript_3560/g.5742 Transcript_3560/m.5742 type:complete len:317 (-) Transcript_3560:343-1293(-)